MKRARNAIRKARGVFPRARVKRQKEGLDLVERRVFPFTSAGKKISIDVKLERQFFRLLGAMPLRSATLKLVELLKSSSFTLPKRLKAMELLEKRNEMKAQMLYKRLLSVYDMPVPLRSRMVGYLGERIGSGENGIVFRKPLKTAMMDPAQSPIIRRQCVKILASKTRPPKKLFRKLAQDRNIDTSLRVEAIRALEKLEKKKRK